MIETTQAAVDALAGSEYRSFCILQAEVLRKFLPPVFAAAGVEQILTDSLAALDMWARNEIGDEELNAVRTRVAELEGG